MVRVELDKRALFALASDTRVEILHALRPMRRTVTQLADELSIDKAAIHRHLQKLVEGGLVERVEDHSFVYYGLSWKTRDILDPNDNTKIVLLLASSIILALVASAAILAAALPFTQGLVAVPNPDSLADRGTGELSQLEDYMTLGAGESAQSPPLIYVAMGAGTVLAALAMALILMALRLHRPPKQLGAQAE